MAAPPAGGTMQGKEISSDAGGLPELARLAKLLEGLVQEAESSHAQACDSLPDEPESEEGGSVDNEGHSSSAAVEGPLAQAAAEVQELQTTLPKRWAAPGAQEELPGAVGHLTGLLERTLRLATVQAEQKQSLSLRLARAQAQERRQEERAARAEAACATAEADAGQGEKAHELLENTLSRLTAARKSLKEREWELAEARRRLAQLEEDRDQHTKRIRTLETKLDRAAIRGAEQPADPAEKPDAGQHVDLRRRLTVAEAALDCAERRTNKAQVSGEMRAGELEQQLTAALGRVEDLEAKVAEAAGRAEAGDQRAEQLQAQLAQALSSADNLGQQLEEARRATEQQREELQRVSEERCQDLKRRLEDATARAEDLEERLAAAPSPSTPLGTLAEEEEGEAEEEAEAGEAADVGLDASAPPAPRMAIPNLGLERFAAMREEQQGEAYVDGVGILTPRTMAKPTPRTSLRNSLSKRGGVGAASPGYGTPPQASRGPPQTPGTTGSRPSRRSTGSAASSASGEAGPSMPMDLRALGKLLTGGGLVSKKSSGGRPAPAE